MNEPTGPNESMWAARIKSILGWRIRAEVADWDCDENGNVRPIPVGTLGYVHSLNHIDRDGEPNFDILYDQGSGVVLSYSQIMRECVLIEPPGGPVNWEQYPTTHPHKPGATY